MTQNKKKYFFLGLILVGILTYLLIMRSNPKDDVIINGETVKEPTSQSNLQDKSVDRSTPKSLGKKTEQDILIKKAANKVKKEVEELNKQEELAEQAILDAGWKPTQTEPPDEKVLNLDPSLLGEQEHKLQKMIQSTSLREDNIDNIVTIAMLTQNKKTRYVAIEALGQSRYKQTPSKLIELYNEIDSTEDQSHILSLMIPKKLDDSTYQFLIKIINDPTSDTKIKKQASSAIFAFGLSKNYTTEDFEINILPSLDENEHKYIRGMYHIIK